MPLHLLLLPPLWLLSTRRRHPPSAARPVLTPSRRVCLPLVLAQRPPKPAPTRLPAMARLLTSGLRRTLLPALHQQLLCSLLILRRRLLMRRSVLLTPTLRRHLVDPCPTCPFQSVLWRSILSAICFGLHGARAFLRLALSRHVRMAMMVWRQRSTVPRGLSALILSHQQLAISGRHF